MYRGDCIIYAYNLSEMFQSRFIKGFFNDSALVIGLHKIFFFFIKVHLCKLANMHKGIYGGCSKRFLTFIFSFEMVKREEEELVM